MLPMSHFLQHNIPMTVLNKIAFIHNIGALIWAIHHHPSCLFWTGNSFIHINASIPKQINKFFLRCQGSLWTIKKRLTYTHNVEIMVMREGGGKLIRCTLQRKFASLKTFKRDIRFTLCSFFISRFLFLLITPLTPCTILNPPLKGKTTRLLKKLS